MVPRHLSQWLFPKPSKTTPPIIVRSMPLIGSVLQHTKPKGACTARSPHISLIGFCLFIWSARRCSVICAAIFELFPDLLPPGPGDGFDTDHGRLMQRNSQPSAEERGSLSSGIYRIPMKRLRPTINIPFEKMGHRPQFSTRSSVITVATADHARYSGPRGLRFAPRG